jgi:hypothetical protein
MERRSFIKKSAATAGAAVAFSTVNAGTSGPAPNNKSVYEWKVYQLVSGSTKNQVKEYYLKAVIPFLNKKGGKVGFFTEYSLQEPPKLYVLSTYPTMQEYFSIQQEMVKDEAFQANAKSYNELPAEKPLFTRYETYLLEAFDTIPQLRMPDPKRGLLELRTYESYNEDAGRRKILMFNKEEIKLFDKIGLKSVFFGKILAGKQMPALMYMLWFENMDQRTALWDKFRAADEWNTMRVKPEYANTVSTVNKIFLLPEEGSQI